MAADTDKQQKDNGLKDYGIIYLSGPINGGTAESVCKEIIDLNIKGGLPNSALHRKAASQHFCHFFLSSCYQSEAVGK